MAPSYTVFQCMASRQVPSQTMTEDTKQQQIFLGLKKIHTEIPLKSKRGAEPCGSTRFDYAPQGTLCSVKPEKIKPQP